MDLPSPARHELRLVDILHALSDPVRLQIVCYLDRADGILPCGAIQLPVGKSTKSHHFRVLREAGVTTTHVDGTRRYNTLRRDDLDARFPGLLDAVLSAAATPSTSDRRNHVHSP
jgi:DNA-binding transcriptional ArsR family regulator